ncbi:MAG: hypothetical protein V4450_13480 [Bacteroidota bacterium]
MRTKLIIVLLLISFSSMAQELYVYTEPASNMAAKSIGLRLNNFIMPESYTAKTNYHMIPEIMVGVSKTTMVHFDAFLSNRNKGLSAEGGSIYAKYRFLSNDEVQKHFRMAAFGRYSFNNSDIHQEEINLYGHNTGFETGVVATQLLHKVAISSGLSFIKALDNGGNNKFPYGNLDRQAVNYTLSIGKLMLPKEYTDYKQTNLNLMLEFLNQFNLGSGKYYMDIAPSMQLIFNSVARVDIGYRQQLSSSLYRTAPNGLFMRLEYNLFNAY